MAAGEDQEHVERSSANPFDSQEIATSGLSSKGTRDRSRRGPPLKATVIPGAYMEPHLNNCLKAEGNGTVIPYSLFQVSKTAPSTALRRSRMTREPPVPFTTY